MPLPLHGLRDVPERAVQADGRRPAVLELRDLPGIQEIPAQGGAAGADCRGENWMMGKCRRCGKTREVIDNICEICIREEAEGG